MIKYSLEELISQCPKEITAPNRNIDKRTPIAHLFRLIWCGSEWCATYQFYASYVETPYNFPLEGTGKTPTGAVRKLIAQLKHHHFISRRVKP